MSDSVSDLFIQSAVSLGEYALVSEWNCVVEEYTPMTDVEFFEWIKTSYYYHALMCAIKGDPNEVSYQLQADYKELNEESPLEHYQKETED
jgi:hypothetical protein